MGATSQSAPPCRSGMSPALTAMNGTGFVVCAVCGPPVAGSSIISALPWSAVTSTWAPTRSAAARMRPRLSSIVSTAVMTAGMTPVWPTMSALAKLLSRKSCDLRSSALHSASVTPRALISGMRSYVATFALGTRVRSSPL